MTLVRSSIAKPSIYASWEIISENLKANNLKTLKFLIENDHIDVSQFFITPTQELKFKSFDFLFELFFERTPAGRGCFISDRRIHLLPSILSQLKKKMYPPCRKE